ncbi:hypothetical protein V6N11_044005 [Hibiscus sabdariffa]|uniref:DOC domain-containing protein n=1 Tax=Hibiscus sabdariffa TaxID=183260 RepID=A0ABR2RE79_9ROSI
MATESSESEEEGKITGGNQHLVVEDDLREMGKKAAWSVSSCKTGNGVSSLRDDNLETYWQSDGAQPHLVNIQFQKKVKLQLDESYTPSKISIRAGDGFHNLKEIKTVELVKPTGWVYLSLSGNDPRETFVNTFMLQIAVLSNHLNGRDTHVRQIKVYGPRPNPIPHQPFQFTSREFITYSTVRHYFSSAADCIVVRLASFLVRMCIGRDDNKEIAESWKFLMEAIVTRPLKLRHQHCNCPCHLGHCFQGLMALLIPGTREHTIVVDRLGKLVSITGSLPLDSVRGESCSLKECGNADSIEAAQPRCSLGIKALCSLNNAIEKAKLLLRYCGESSKLCLAMTTDAIVSRCQKAKNLLEQGLCQVQSKVPVMLAVEFFDQADNEMSLQISQVVDDLRAANFVPYKFDAGAGNAVRELLQASAGSSNARFSGIY